MKEKLTINDIAKLSGTSKTTVSFYLNGKTERISLETQNRLKEVIKKTNYTPNALARSLNSKSMKLIGVIIGDITNSFANQIVKGIENVAKANNYQVVFGNSDYDFQVEKDHIKRMSAMGVEGFIVQPTVKFEIIEQEMEKDFKNIVFIDSQTRSDKKLWVKTNNYEAVYDACETIIKMGYEKYIMITADPSILSTRLERTRGFEHALSVNGFTCKTKIVTTDTKVEEIQEYLDKNIDDKKTCVFVPNCWVLNKVFMALRHKSEHISDKIKILGFDNSDWTDFSCTPISTIVQPAYEEGVAAAKILIDRIEGTLQEPPNQILKCSYKWR